MKTLGNVLWIIFGGLFVSIGYFLTGILLCCTIILIPVGIQFFKLGKFAFLPFEKKVEDVNPSGFKKVVNVIWAVLGGWVAFLLTGLVGIILCITIIGIPFGKQYFKIAKFSLLPLGKDFVEAK